MPGLFELAQDLEQLQHQHRRQAKRELVDHQHIRLGHDAAPHRQHLLLAAAQACRLSGCGALSSAGTLRTPVPDWLEMRARRAWAWRPFPGSRLTLISVNKLAAFGHQHQCPYRPWYRAAVGSRLCPSKQIDALPGRISPMTVRSRVVLPTPLPPTNEVSLPSCSARLAPHKICTSP